MNQVDSITEGISKNSKFVHFLKKLSTILEYLFALLIWPILCLVYSAKLYTLYWSTGLGGNLLIFYGIVFAFLFVGLTFVSNKEYFTGAEFNIPFVGRFTFPYVFITTAKYDIYFISLNILGYFAPFGFWGKLVIVLQLVPLFYYLLVISLLVSAMGSYYLKNP